MSIQHCGTGNPMPANCYTTIDGVTTVFNSNGSGAVLRNPIENPFEVFATDLVTAATAAADQGPVELLLVGLIMITGIALTAAFTSLIALKTENRKGDEYV